MYSSLALMTTFVLGAFAQSTTVQPIFLGGPSQLAASQSWAASVANVGPSDTTYAIVCTSGCPSSVTQSLTSGTSNFDYNYETTLNGNAASISETCQLSGTTAASCVLTISLSVAGQSTEIVTTTEFSGASYGQVPVTITAGAEKLAASTASASSTKGSSSSGSSASAASSSASASTSGSGASSVRASGRAGDLMALVLLPSVAVVIGALLIL